MPDDSITLLATCTLGLESVLSRECQDLGLENAEPDGVGRVRIPAATTADIAKLNIRLRTANRVLIELSRFDAPDFDALFEQTKSLPWHRWLDPTTAMPVRVSTLRSKLTSVPACTRTVKKAVVEAMLAGHAATALPEDGPIGTIVCRLLNDEASLAIDTSGTALHKRGYRPVAGPAPLRETLAAGIVILSRWHDGRPFIDPFCGTGTLAIEAALLTRNIAPGLQRAHKHDIASMHWPAMPSDTWQAAIEDARAAETEPDNQLYIHAYDNDERATKLARRAAEEAGVDGDIHIQTRDFADLSTKLEGGCLITNPPYGRRLGERQAAEQLYRDMPGVLRRLSTWAHFILAEHPGFEKLVGQPATRRRKLYNGTVKCTLFSFVPDRRRAHDNDTPQTPAAAFGGTTSTDDNLVQTFQATLAKRWRHFRKWPDRGIEAYRLYDRDTPGVPLAVDRYRDHLHIAEFEGNAPHTAAQHADFLDALCKAASKTTGIERDKIHLKTRRRQRRRQDGIAEGQGQYDRVDDARSVMTTNEHGLKYEVNLSDYLDTGLFLDHRETRKMVREHAHNERVLNLFCYTGSFTVAAAAGGAETTTSVDTSNTYLDWAWRNLELNSLADERHRLVRTDAEQFLVEHPPGEHYDIAIVDPPTFSNNRSEQRVWDVQHDHAHLLQLVAKLMSADGVIYFSNNARRFELADNVPGVAREITNRTTPEDFRRRPAHRCWLLRARPEGW